MIKSLYALFVLLFKDTKKKWSCPDCGRGHLESIDALNDNDCQTCIEYIEKKIKE